MFIAEPVHRWEVPQGSDALICSALARGRPAALDRGSVRLGGSEDAEVATRYRVLRTAVVARLDGGRTEEFHALEAAPPATSWTRWQTMISTAGLDDDISVVERARDVWVALGPNEYALYLRARPRTFRGRLESFLWSMVAAIGAACALVAAAMLFQTGDARGWIFVTFVPLWLAGVAAAFRHSYRLQKAIGARELPHL